MAPTTHSQSPSLDQRLDLLSLPPTALETVFQQLSTPELGRLSLVSRACRDLAAAQLYRTFTHIFNDDDFRGGATPVDLLAGTLETLATSDYNYARFMKRIEMDTAYAAEAGERACREYSYEYSCGKFLNSLLLATLKRTQALDEFIWNIRVELSSAVFHVLQNMPSLQHLQVRMQAGPSLYSGSDKSISLANPITLPPPPGQLSLPPPPQPVPPPPHPHSHAPGGFATYPPITPQTRLSKRLPLTTALSLPSSFSGFRNLKSLFVLDMDTLDYVPELATCIRSSTMSLKRLKLSFSESLALKARKKVSQDSDSDDTAPEDDEFENEDLPPPPPPGLAPNNLPFGAATGLADGDVRVERLAQEEALARIFGLETETPAARTLEKAADVALEKANQETRTELDMSQQETEREKLGKMIRSAFSKVRAGKDRSSMPYKMIDHLEKAAWEYLDDKDEKMMDKAVTDVTGTTPGMSSINLQNKTNSFNYSTNGLIAEEEGSLFLNPAVDVYSHEPGYTESLDNFDFEGFLAVNPPSTSIGPFTSDKKKTSAWQQAKTGQKKQAQVAVNKTTSLEDFQAELDAQASTLASSGTNTQSKTTDIEDLKPTSPSFSSSSAAQLVEEAQHSQDADDESTTNTTADTKSAKARRDRAAEEYPDDVDMDHPDDDGEEGEDQAFMDTPESAADEISGSVKDGLQTQHLKSSPTPEEQDTQTVTALDKGKRAVRQLSSPSESQRPLTTGDAIQEYVRLNHGIPIEELSIYLIPVKPSVLCRAIDICALKKITLLNVGPQRAFWAMLGKLHKTNPLQLRSIYTDNVTPIFLLFLNGLDCLEDLFLLERNSRTKVEPFAPKSLVTIEDIRKQVLKKHLSGLRTLMIRNDDGNDWNINKETVKLITKEGKSLKELAVSTTTTVFHMLMQSFSGLRSLYALQIILASNTDACHSVLRELRACVVDNLSHCPDVPVKYVALSHTINGSLNTFLMRLVRNPQDLDNNGSDSDDWPAETIRVFESLKLREAENVKMWDKEAWATRL